jgi:hypothetical protein
MIIIAGLLDDTIAQTTSFKHADIKHHFFKSLQNEIESIIETLKPSFEESYLYAARRPATNERLENL